LIGHRLGKKIVSSQRSRRISAARLYQDAKTSVGQARVFPKPLLRISSQTSKKLKYPVLGIYWVGTSRTLIGVTEKLIGVTEKR